MDLGITDKMLRCRCPGRQSCNPFYRSYLKGFAEAEFVTGSRRWRQPFRSARFR